MSQKTLEVWRRLSRARRGLETGAAHEQLIEAARPGGTAGRQTADAPVVLHELDQDAAGQNPLRTIGDIDIRLLAVTGARQTKVGT